MAQLWREAWDEATGAGAAALRLYANDIVPLVCAGAKGVLIRRMPPKP